MTHTPKRTIRIPDRIWIPAQLKADAMGVTLSEVIRVGLDAWGRRPIRQTVTHKKPLQ